MTIEAWMVLVTAIAMAVSARYVYLTLKPIVDLWFVKLIVISVIGFAISWGGFSFILQTVIPEPSELRKVIGFVSLSSKMICALIFAFGFYKTAMAQEK